MKLLLATLAVYIVVIGAVGFFGAKAQVAEAQSEGPCHWIYVKALESAKLADANNAAGGWGRSPLSESINTQAEMSVMWSQIAVACVADAHGVTR